VEKIFKSKDVVRSSEGDVGDPVDVDDSTSKV
jgi:hypothetical protein